MRIFLVLFFFFRNSQNLRRRSQSSRGGLRRPKQTRAHTHTRARTHTSAHQKEGQDKRTDRSYEILMDCYYSS